MLVSKVELSKTELRRKAPFALASQRDVQEIVKIKEEGDIRPPQEIIEGSAVFGVLNKAQSKVKARS